MFSCKCVTTDLPNVINYYLILIGKSILVYFILCVAEHYGFIVWIFNGCQSGRGRDRSPPSTPNSVPTCIPKHDWHPSFCYFLYYYLISKSYFCSLNYKLYQFYYFYEHLCNVSHTTWFSSIFFLNYSKPTNDSMNPLCIFLEQN